MNGYRQILRQLEACVTEGRYQSLETDWLEVKSVPSSRGQWDSICESVCAFLNTRGGTVVLGIKEEQGPPRRFVFTGYDETQSENVRRIRQAITDKTGKAIELIEHVSEHVEPFMGGQVALVQVVPLSDDRRFAFYKGEAWERSLDGDKRIPPDRVDAQEERKRELAYARELRPVPEATLEDLSLHRLNEYIFSLNRGGQIETHKGTIEEAMPFLVKKGFVTKDNAVTTLGMLVCGREPDRLLSFRSHLDGFVDVPAVVAQDKKTFRDNVLQLMEAGIGWTLRNIQTGISVAAGGTMTAEYPERLVRECINNALAHRDYSINRPVQLTLKPRISLAIRNPGSIPAELVFEKLDHDRPVRRIFANPKARNPKLADVLKVFNKWEGRGVGMADLTNYALRNEIDLPYYLFHSAEELSLVIPSGRVLDESVGAWLDLFDGFIASRTGGAALNDEQRVVLAYVLKSEQANRLGRYTIALTSDNNHFQVLADLERWKLIAAHPESDRYHRIYVAAPELVETDVSAELRELFGASFNELDGIYQSILQMVCIAGKHSKSGGLNAKQITRLLGSRLPDELHRRGEDEFYRAIRYRVAKLAPNKADGGTEPAPDWITQPDKMLVMKGTASSPVFAVNRGFQKPLL